MTQVLSVGMCLVMVGFESVVIAQQSSAWKLHQIDASSRGADGVRMADINADGLLDITTGWEEGSVVRVYWHPGYEKSAKLWPAVTVGRVRSPEDAVFVDLDGDGAIDVVSCCEGTTQSMFVHWAPRDSTQALQASAWKTEVIPATRGTRRWMYCVPLQVDNRYGIDLVAGAKNPGGAVGWLEAPPNPRDLSAWKWHPIESAGWIMSLFATDVDWDGDVDIVTTDRKGSTRGCHWLENPGDTRSLTRPWKVHRIGATGREVMFMAPCDLNQDRLVDFVLAVRNSDLLYLERLRLRPIAWKSHSIRMPPNTGTGKAVAVGDVDLDGQLDLVVSCEHAERKSGIFWLSYRRSPTDPIWNDHDISGKDWGVKFDLVRLLDLDGDGDLDVITCEERDNLGVIWYENPTQ